MKTKTARLPGEREGGDGSPRITAALRDAGWRVSVNIVAGLMREQNLAAADEEAQGGDPAWAGRRRAPDQVRRKFSAGGINRRWYGDGTGRPAAQIAGQRTDPETRRICPAPPAPPPGADRWCRSPVRGKSACGLGSRPPRVAGGWTALMAGVPVQSAVFRWLGFCRGWVSRSRARRRGRSGAWWGQ